MSAEQDRRDQLAEDVARLNAWQLALAAAMTTTTSDDSPAGDQ
jgi:outer membrane murein-binding lipoprotein Lpp